MQKGIIKNVNPLTGDSIDAKDLASIFNSIIGDSSGVFNTFEALELEKISNNEIRLKSGVYSMRGHLLYVAKGTYETFNIDNGTLGQNRIDLFIARYVNNGDGEGEDTLEFAIKKGEQTFGEPVAPVLVQNDINAGGAVFEEALWNIKLNGTEVNLIDQRNFYLSLQELENKTDNAVLDFFGGELVEV